jgi:tyrosyl-tRNA synthetase
MSIKVDQTAIQEWLKRGITNYLEAKHLEQQLMSGRQLRVKFGIDPTSDKIHLGRAVPFWKLRELQDWGHKIVLIIGDFTARIGDASYKDSERPMLSKEQIQLNLTNYIEQISKILDISKVEIRYNSEWLSNLSFDTLTEIANVFSVNEMLDRDNFSQRHNSNTRISLREFLYPLIQGYDSVVVKSDLELGGNDQYFNLIAGRKVQKHYNQEPQDIVTCELLLGIDGRKMSSSWGNGIYITDTPNEMFTKVMAVKDEFIIDYFRLATDLSNSQIEEYNQRLANGYNPRDIKLDLAMSIVGRYYRLEEVNKAKEYFEQLFTKQEIPADVTTIQAIKIEDRRLFAVLAQVFDMSNSESKRTIQEGGVKLNQEIITDAFYELSFEKNQEYILQKGKKNIIKIIS